MTTPEDRYRMACGSEMEQIDRDSAPLGGLIGAVLAAIAVMAMVAVVVFGVGK